MAKPKLSDVAALAGVSPTTVSRVLNNRGYLSENTRTKVHEAMRELGYRPNAIARSLQGQRSQMVVYLPHGCEPLLRGDGVPPRKPPCRRGLPGHSLQ